MSNFRNPKNYAVDATTPDPENSIEDIVKRVNKIEQEGGGSGTTDYNALENKPAINGETLSGDKSSDDLHIKPGLKPTVDGETIIFS